MKRSGLPDNKQIISGFLSKDESLITKLYDIYRTEFISFGQKYFSIEEQIAVEIYQDSFLVLYQNVRNGKLSKLSASLKTYLFQIGKYKMLNYVNRVQKRGAVLHDISLHINDPDWERKQEIACKMLSVMNEPCNTILNLAFWEERSLAYIADVMKYKSVQVAKNSKRICIRRLKQILEEKFRAEGLI
ncbi:MAG: hypothetical protein LBL90_08385 [Prevotellaceae bacterium]|jgi:RNA polymerase sigma factor (sigma-70 family)|nr:hypothetical protein [Prevotellaceae bacterium]